MRMSCNGCRVLRKGCSDDCSIRPCLQWIKNPQSQANATLFLAKFYGRAGLMNLINAGPNHLRPAIFRSLLYEACGRILNPIYGSVGLLWSGTWQLCQAAVEAVLKGDPIIAQIIPSDTAAASPLPPFKPYDIRHVTRRDSGADLIMHRVSKTTRTRFKRCSNRKVINQLHVDTDTDTNTDHLHPQVEDTITSRSLDDSSAAGSHVTDQGELSAFSVGEAASHVTLEADTDTDTHTPKEEEESTDVELELTLGFQSRVSRSVASVPERTCDDDTCRFDLGL